MSLASMLSCMSALIAAIWAAAIFGLVFASASAAARFWAAAFPASASSCCGEESQGMFTLAPGARQTFAWFWYATAMVARSRMSFASLTDRLSAC